LIEKATIATLLAAARARLGNTFSAALDARLLMQEATGMAHADIIAHADDELNGEMAQKFEALIIRRLAHEPVSRILGRREFYGRSFIVTPDVLDPRPDTETVVELALKHTGAGRFVDLGTGSGAIAITLCAENAQLSGLAVDISPAALRVAERNAQAQGLAERLTFRQGNWLHGVTETFDLIISNPPYIRAGESLMREVFNHDPHLALFAGTDGLEAYRAIAATCGACLAPQGRVVVEIGAGQAGDVTALFETSGLVLLESADDLQGHARALAFARHKPV
jgi:release factor glutamine methyltransferase